MVRRILEPGKMELSEIGMKVETTRLTFAKDGFKSEDTGEVLLLQDKYSKLLSLAENLNKLFTD